MTLAQRARTGAQNLLRAAKLTAGDQLLLLCEDPALGWYDDKAPRLVADLARERGAFVTIQQTGGPDNRFIDDELDETALTNVDYDCCIFFTRIGDQLRFRQSGDQRRRVMCYARTLEMLASDYGRIEYAATVDLKDTIDALLAEAPITISCPRGTRLSGTNDIRVEDTDEVTITRFPMGVHAPIHAKAFSGEIQLFRYLTSTGSRTYEPLWIELDAPVTAELRDGRIVGYRGDAGSVRQIQHHYRRIADQFRLQMDVVHSWHAGVHPGSHATEPATTDPDRWSNTVFTNPRFLHFHTCSDRVMPGEICWMVLDPTIAVDGVALWRDGVLLVDAFAETRACLDRWPELQPLFANGNADVGLLS